MVRQHPHKQTQLQAKLQELQAKSAFAKSPDEKAAIDMQIAKLISKTIKK
jgi:hypothetical protein